MSPSDSPLKLLGTRLCPWLKPALERLDAAHRSGRLGHAWLITGPAGTGKLNLALLFADRLLRAGPAGDPPELVAADAVTAMRGRHGPADHHPDLYWLFPEEDKRTIAVEQIRATAESLTLKSHAGGAKVVVIEPADGMTVAASNALLKTLEEPAGDTYLLLLSEQPGLLPATIRSRCQRVAIERPSAAVLRSWLPAGEAGALAAYAELSGNAPLRIAEMLSDNNILLINKLTDDIRLISEDKIDPQTVAEAWVKLPDGFAFHWLERRLHAEIRRRLAPNVSKAVTDGPEAILHNPWAKMTLRSLFEQQGRVERLRGLFGSGINMELALHSLLIGLQAPRGRS